MTKIETKDNNWMLEIIEHYENSLVDAYAGFTKTGQYSDNGNTIPGTKYLEFEPVEAETIELDMGNGFPVWEQGIETWINNRFRLMNEIIETLKNINDDNLKLELNFEFGNKYDMQPAESEIKIFLRIFAEWQEA